MSEQEFYPMPLFVKLAVREVAASAHWYNKSDNGIIIWRDFDKGYTEAHVKKIKFRNYGSPGIIRFIFDNNSGGFIEDAEYEKDSERKWFD